jgi:hypothetical protein
VAVSPSSVPSPHVSLAAPVWVPSASAPAVAAPSPVAGTPAPTQPAPAPSDVPSDTITTPPTPTGTQTAKPRPTGKPTAGTSPQPQASTLESLLDAAQKALQ